MDKQHKTHSKAINSLKRNAEKGNLLSMLQLYENYKSGKNVGAVSEKLAETYLASLVEKLPLSKFRIEAINLSEFRRFRELNIRFDNLMTVIIGDNGAGKTSIAEAIAKILSWFSQNLVKSNVSGKRIVEHDINVNSKDYSQVTGQFQLGDNSHMSISLATPISGYSGNVSSSVTQAKQMGDLYRLVAEVEQIELPIFAFYSVERSAVRLPKISLDKTFLKVSNSRFNALKEGLDASTHLEEFSRKYIELFNLAEGENTPEIRELRKTISYLHDLITRLHEGKPLSNDHELVKELEAKEKELEELTGKKSTKYTRMTELVGLAITTLLPDITEIKVDRSTGNQRILVKNFGNIVNISQLSQGQKSLLALSGDLALRLVTLNPDSKNALHSSGVVVIDEIELHLHPKWQQRIIMGLQKAFPNIQFIITTHSPQVLSTVDKSCIRQICFDDHSELTVTTPQFQTKGVTSADILARIMETNSTPENIEEATWLNDFSRCLKNADQEALAVVFLKIREHYGASHPVVIDCESQIRIFEMKARLNKG